jgi:hypothetical protein
VEEAGRRGGAEAAAGHRRRLPLLHSPRGGWRGEGLGFKGGDGEGGGGGPRTRCLTECAGGVWSRREERRVENEGPIRITVS